jgi:hypothetical protein
LAFGKDYEFNKMKEKCYYLAQGTVFPKSRPLDRISTFRVHSHKHSTNKGE